MEIDFIMWKIVNLRQISSFPSIIAPLPLLFVIGVRNNTGGKSTKLDLAEGWGRGERWKVYGKVGKGYLAQSLIRSVGKGEVATSSLYTFSLSVTVVMSDRCDFLGSLFNW